VAIVRLSGRLAFHVQSKLFRMRSKAESHRLQFGELVGSDGTLIDRCLSVWMQGPGSYTGEDVVEFHTHGGSTLAALTVQACLESGARLARPGEFTMRAFLNGKIDLAQAEAVQQLIASRHQKAAQLAAQNLVGAFSHQVETLRDQLLQWLTLLEAEIDFGDEVDSYPAEAGLLRCQTHLDTLDRLLEGAQGGQVCAEGLRTVLLGPPNAGKSTLLNLILGRERALVTPIPGTTRDTLEEMTVLGGIVLHVVDTAGIRSEPGDLVEKLGIDRSRRQGAAADLILLVLDGSQPLPDMDEFLALAENVGTVVFLNKSDLGTLVSAEELCQRLPLATFCQLSLIRPEGAQVALDEIMTAARRVTGQHDQVFSLTRRQLEALTRCRESLNLVRSTLEAGYSAEFVCLDLRKAIGALGEIQGIDITDEVLDRIFSTFCLGK
jgi:tRNA modification GTPase